MCYNFANNYIVLHEKWFPGRKNRYPLRVRAIKSCVDLQPYKYICGYYKISSQSCELHCSHDYSNGAGTRLITWKWTVHHAKLKELPLLLKRGRFGKRGLNKCIEMKVRKVFILEGAHDANASGGGGMYWPAILNPLSMMYMY